MLLLLPILGLLVALAALRWGMAILDRRDRRPSGSTLTWSRRRFALAASGYLVGFVALAVFCAVKDNTLGLVISSALALVFALVLVRTLQRGSPGERLTRRRLR